MRHEKLKMQTLEAVKRRVEAEQLFNWSVVRNRWASPESSNVKLMKSTVSHQKQLSRQIEVQMWNTSLLAVLVKLHASGQIQFQ
jgi:hypothetical protein